MRYDVIIVGGGPAGLSAALALGRARRRVLLCDAGPRRNARATNVHNFVTRDGTPPEIFRATARQELAAYPNVRVCDSEVASLAGARGLFEIQLTSERCEARRILLCTGMVDELLPLPGFAELWGHAIFQCPYCHGWEAQDRRWGYLVRAADLPHFAIFALQARSWTRALTVFKESDFELPTEARAQLASAAIRIEMSPVRRLLVHEQRIEAIELESGALVDCDVLFAHPPQRQVSFVRELRASLDADGYLKVDPMTHETSLAGVYAAGDLTTRMQAAVVAASAGMRAAAAIHVELTMELAARGELEERP